MVRFLQVLVGLLVCASCLEAQDLGRTDRLWREYLQETVRRGVPLLSYSPTLVPSWPALNRARWEAQSLEPGTDATLMGAWIDYAEGSQAEALAALRGQGAQARLVRWPSRRWGEALFTVWDPRDTPREWTDAWLSWDEKAYSPLGLRTGIEGLELIDPSAVDPLLAQAVELYPSDRRFLPLLARHPSARINAQALVSRDRERSGGWALSSVARLLHRQPTALALLAAAGYEAEVLNAAVQDDYARLLRDPSVPSSVPQAWVWDADQDGDTESRVTFDANGLATWSRRTAQGLWTLSFREGLPESLIETRSGASWTLRWDAYPWASTLEYRWGRHTLVYRFRPLAQELPLWPAERLTVPSSQLPAALATLWLPLNPRALAGQAAAVETWDGDRRLETMYLYRGEVWLEVKDSNRDGVEDQWSYYRGGVLASVYSDLEGKGQATLRELYSRGELKQVQNRAAKAPQAEFVLFPQEGVQLWDPHGDRRPLERLFVWSGAEKLGALVFSQQDLPWETMPQWEPRP